MHVVKYVKQSSLILKTERKNIERMRQVARPVLPYPPLLFELSFILSLCSVLFQAHSDKHIHSLILFYALLFFCPACWILLHRYSAPRRTTIDQIPLHLPPPIHTRTHTRRLHLTHPALSSCYANEPQEQRDGEMTGNHRDDSVSS